MSDSTYAEILNDDIEKKTAKNFMVIEPSSSSSSTSSSILLTTTTTSIPQHQSFDDYYDDLNYDDFFKDSSSSSSTPSSLPGDSQILIGDGIKVTQLNYEPELWDAQSAFIREVGARVFLVVPAIAIGVSLGVLFWVIFTISLRLYGKFRRKCLGKKVHEDNGRCDQTSRSIEVIGMGNNNNNSLHQRPLPPIPDNNGNVIVQTTPLTHNHNRTPPMASEIEMSVIRNTNQRVVYDRESRSVATSPMNLSLVRTPTIASPRAMSPRAMSPRAMSPAPAATAFPISSSTASSPIVINNRAPVVDNESFSSGIGKSGGSSLRITSSEEDVTSINPVNKKNTFLTPHP